MTGYTVWGRGLKFWKFSKSKYGGGSVLGNFFLIVVNQQGYSVIPNLCNMGEAPKNASTIQNYVHDNLFCVNWFLLVEGCNFNSPNSVYYNPNLVSVELKL